MTTKSKSKKRTLLSVVIATYNEEKNIDKCLASIADIADEIVVVDGGSSDATIQLAASYGARILQTTNPPIFHKNKQKAVDAARGVWILQIDADERITKKLQAEILKTISPADNQSAGSAIGYSIARKNYFCGKWMRHGGMYPDYVVRLFRRGKGRFPSKSVHEQIEVDGNVEYLKEPMVHMTYPTFEDYMKKADTYTSLTAQEMMQSGSGNTVRTLVGYVLVKPLTTFLSLYVRHKGVLDGWWGFVWCFMSAMHYPMAYIKFLELGAQEGAEKRT